MASQGQKLRILYLMRILLERLCSKPYGRNIVLCPHKIVISISDRRIDKTGKFQRDCYACNK